MPLHPLNRQTRLWLAAVFVTVLAFLIVLALADGATAHRRRSRGFEPSERTLACIRGPWAGRPMESGGNYANTTGGRYQGAYQSDRNFELAYAVRVLGPEHWARWGSNPADRSSAWHPMIQDEMARNGVRARGLQPWSRRVRAVCPRA